MAVVFCRKCGSQIQADDKFCFKCGEKVPSAERTPKAEAETTNKALTLDEFSKLKGSERSRHFSSKRKLGSEGDSSGMTTSTKKPGKCVGQSASKRLVTVQVGIMRRDDFGNLKCVRASRLPVKIDMSVDADTLKTEAIQKHASYDQAFCALEDYHLLYPDGKEVIFIPGTTALASPKPFQLCAYKEDLGKPYSQIYLFLCTPYHFEADSQDSLLQQSEPMYDDQTVIPDYFYVGDEGMGLVSLFDNVLPMERSEQPLQNAGTVSENYTLNLVPSDLDQATNIFECFNKKMDNVRSLMFENDDHVTLMVRRRKIYLDTHEKLKRLFADGVKPIIVQFVAEPAVDAGGPVREFFALYFEDAQRHLMQGKTAFTFIHDLQKLSNGDFELYGKIIALSLLHQCPGPRNMILAVASRILGDISVKPSVDELPDFDVSEKLQAIIQCSGEQTLQEKVADFEERFSMGFNKPTVTMDDKETMCESIAYHNCISVCLEEIKAVRQGLSMLSVLDILEAHKDDGIKELAFSEPKISAQDFLKVFSHIHYCKLEGSSIDIDKMKESEEDIIYNLTNCLDAIQARECQAIEVIDIDTDEHTTEVVTKKTTLQDLLRFGTGAKYITPSLYGKGNIEFMHLSGEQVKSHSGMRLKANTCSVTLTFPVNERYTCSSSLFMKNIVDDIHSSPGFGNV